MQLAFTKYEGTANDFVVVDVASLQGRELGTAEAVALCDRHRGIGADGVLLVGWGEGRASMRVINADGSIPQMCGNGLRCVVAHLARTDRVQGGSVVVDTDAGPHECVLTGEGPSFDVEITMRIPSLAPGDLPVRAGEELRDAAFDVDGRALHLTAVSMGNPHAVTFDDVGDARRELGPRLERDPRFPEGVNVGFARMVDQAIELFVFERGSGWTEACGTGACAAAVAAVETGRIPRGRTVAVTLPGGTLAITVGAPGEPVRMRGPARFVFAGTVDRSAP